MAEPAPAGGGAEVYVAVEQRCCERKASLLLLRLASLRASIDSAAKQLDAMKLSRKGVEQGSRGSLKEAATATVTAQTLKDTILRLEEDLLKTRSRWEALKSTPDAERLTFKNQLDKMNQELRELFEQSKEKLALIKHSLRSTLSVEEIGYGELFSSNCQHLLEGEYGIDLHNHNKALHNHDKPQTSRPKVGITNVDTDVKLDVVTRDFQKVSLTSEVNMNSKSSAKMDQNISDNRVFYSEDLVKDLVGNVSTHREEETPKLCSNMDDMELQTVTNGVLLSLQQNKEYIHRHEYTSSSEDSTDDSELDLESDGEENADKHLQSVSTADKRRQLTVIVSNQWDQKPSSVLPNQSQPLPPLPEFEVFQQAKSPDDSDASTNSTSNGDTLDDTYPFGSLEWESLTAPLLSLASEAEEEDMMYEAAVRLVDDPTALEIIAEHDKAEAAKRDWYLFIGFLGHGHLLLWKRGNQPVHDLPI